MRRSIQIHTLFTVDMFAQMVMRCKKYKEYFDRVINAFNIGNCPDDRIEKGEVPRWSASPNRRYRDIDPAIRRQGQIFEDYVALEHFKSDATLDLRLAGYGSTSATLAGGVAGVLSFHKGNLSFGTSPREGDYI